MLARPESINCNVNIPEYCNYDEGMRRELAAEAASAAQVTETAENQRDAAVSECKAAEAKLAKQHLDYRGNLDELLLQRTSLEESCQHADHLQRLSRQRTSYEEEAAAKAIDERHRAQAELQAENEEKEKLSALVALLHSLLISTSTRVTALGVKHVRCALLLGQGHRAYSRSRCRLERGNPQPDAAICNFNDLSQGVKGCGETQHRTIAIKPIRPLHFVGSTTEH